MSFTDDPRWRRDPLGTFNTSGQRKCQHCSNYFPENWASSHIDNCADNPANQTTTESNPEEST